MDPIVEEAEPGIETEADDNRPMSLFSGDKFYDLHPDHILGEAHQVSGRFGPVIKYRGDLSALDRIDVPLDFIGNQRTLEDPLLSTNPGDFNLSGSVMEPAMADFIDGVNEKSGKDIERVREKRMQKKTSPTGDENLVTPLMPELNSFEDIYRMYNPEISRDELEVFVWYKSSVKKPLSRRWVNLLEEVYFNDLSEPAPYEVVPAKISDWADRGLLYFFEGKYLPAFLYLSGDIYARKFQLVRDKEQIIAVHGQAVYDNQETALAEVYRRKYEARLIIGGPGSEEGLVILPTAKFAESFQVDGLESMGEGDHFKIKKIKAESSKSFGRPDFLKDAETSDYKKDTFEKLSLRDAYAYWLTKGNPDIKENVTAVDIIKFYLNGSPVRSNLDEFATKEQIRAEQAQQLKFKSSLQKEGERLFKIFLDTELTLNDKVRLETEWNAKYNNYVPVDYNKVPVAFTMVKFYKGKPEVLRPEKREAVAFVLSTGTGCLAYDVGVGKTPSAIFTISAFMDAGYTKRPFVCVPNQVYKQFIQEIRDFAPHIPVLEGYNFGPGYIENFRDAGGKILPVAAGCITVMTYEGLEQIGFSDATADSLFANLYLILNQGGESDRKPSARQKEGFEQRLATLIGKGLRGSLFNIEDFGFDFGCYDEAHKLKKIFTAVKGEAQTDDKGKTSREKNPYAINSGTPSSIGLKAFMLNQYILKQNGYQNVLLLTATPFTNSPLEIFSMLAMLAYEQLQDTDLNNIKNFFDTYIQTSTELVINTKLKPEFKQVILGFNNLLSMQTLIRRYINYKTGEDVNVQRPNKYVLPYTHTLVDGTVIAVPESERVETYLQMTPQQTAMMNDVIAYAEETLSLAQLGNVSYSGASPDTAAEVDPEEEEGETTSIGEEVEEDDLGEEEKKGVRILRSMNFARNLALSPYLYEYSGLGKPDYLTYIETSPKLHYICQCIRSVKDYHENKGEPVSGQVIYMDRGIEYFGLIRDYLIKVVGYKPHEVGIIKSGMPAGTKSGSKEYIKNLFNGELYNISSKTFDQVPDEDRMKVLIGSSTIKEGINLQRYSTVLYDAWLDWNPTDFQQLSGRIWRQGNVFNSVRINLPLVADSMDIFIFQKLQEKTTRLNTIWSTDGRKNVLKLEEFDPSELKYALIRNPYVVAELKIVDETGAIEGEILGIRRLSTRIDAIKEQMQEIDSNFDNAVKFVQLYRNFEPTGDRLKDAQKLVVLTQDILRKQTDKEGKRLVHSYERRSASTQEREDMSELDPAYKQYWFDGFNLAQRNISKELRDFIIPNGIPFRLEDPAPLDEFKKRSEDKIEVLDARKAKLRDKENINAIAQEVIADRESKKITYKPLREVVNDFNKLNYLLSDRKVATLAPQVLYDTCPPRENGQLAISESALKHLDHCLAGLPQTREQYIDPGTGTYSEERERIHRQIIDNQFREVRCVTRGRPIAVFTGGSPGSGKSTFLRENAQYLLSPEVFHIDGDELSALLPDYQGWNSSAFSQESSDLVTEMLQEIGQGKCRYDFVYDGTMTRADRYFELIRRAKEMGYETFIIFVEIPFGIAKKRVLERYQRTGRYVAMTALELFHEKFPSGKTRGQEALDLLKPLVDGYVVVDGTTGKITERKGRRLPTDRSYGEFLNGPGEVLPATLPSSEEEPAQVGKTQREVIQGYIDILGLSKKYLSGDELAAAKAKIATLKLSLKFL